MRLARLVPLAVVPFVVVPLVASQPPRGVVAELARGWSGGQAAPQCAPPDTIDGVPSRSCRWARTDDDTSGGAVSGRLAVGRGASLVTWERRTRDAADAARVLDSLGAALVGRGLRAHDCGETEVPAGRARNGLWIADSLLVLWTRVDPPADAPALMIMATDDPSVAPSLLRCDQHRLPDAAVAAGSTALRGESILAAEGFALVYDSVLTVVHYRTNAPARDSADVRAVLAERLARRQRAAARYDQVSPQTTVLVVRPCYTDRCEPPVPGDPRTRPGDYVFLRRADGSFVPRPAAGVTPAPRAAPPPAS